LGGVDSAINLIAYLGGPAALEQIPLAPGARGGAGSVNLLAALTDAAGSIVGALQYVALVRQGCVADAVALERLAQGVRRRGAEQPAQLNDYEQNVGAFLKKVTFRCGPPQPEDYPPAVMAPAAAATARGSRGTASALWPICNCRPPSDKTGAVGLRTRRRARGMLLERMSPRSPHPNPLPKGEGTP
jgi:hypothetical protein